MGDGGPGAGWGDRGGWDLRHLGRDWGLNLARLAGQVRRVPPLIPHPLAFRAWSKGWRRSIQFGFF